MRQFIKLTKNASRISSRAGRDTHSQRRSVRAMFLCAGCAIQATTASADILHVPAQFPTIQAASNAASAGDEIVVAPGTYKGFVTGVRLTVTGSGTTGTPTVIAGTIRSLDSITLNTLVITDGLITNGPNDLVADCSVINRGLELSNSTISIERTRFDGCVGGALFISNCGGDVQDCDLTNNTSISNGGAIRVDDNTNINVDGCTFMGNHAGENGGAIYTRGFAGEIIVTDSMFKNNTAGNGGAIYFDVTFGSLDLARCAFIGNQSFTNASAVWLTVSDDGNEPGSIFDCSFENNTAVAVDGAALWLSEDDIQPSPPMELTRFCGNSPIDIRGDYIDNGGNTFSSACICLADTNGDGALTSTDFTAWLNAFNNNLSPCDQNNDGACTATDFTAWITNFNAGC
jgi:predicted outer membrane repeat protein